jgi:hypothetical protein
MIGTTLAVALLGVPCAGCASSYFYKVQVADRVDPLSFQASLDQFLRTQGFLPFRELHVTNGLPRWDKDFEFSGLKGAGFMAVELDPPYNPIVINIGATDNRLQEQDQIEGELTKWLHGAYPNVEVIAKKVRFSRFPW